MGSEFPPYPQFVDVLNQPSAEKFHDRVKRRAEAILADLGENEALQMEYHSSSGEPFYVRTLGYSTESDESLLIVAEDAEGNECQILAHVVGLHLLLRVVPVEGPEERKPIGFSAPLEPGE